MADRSGRTPPRQRITPTDSPQTLRTRALREGLDVRARPGAPYLRLEVRNPGHQTHYPVFLPAYPSWDGAFCGCTDFARRGLGTCKHLEAARIWLSEDPTRAGHLLPAFEGGAVWKAIDRGLSELRKESLARSPTLRRAGTALFRGEAGAGARATAPRRRGGSRA
jgi:hypothetical protein